MSEMTSLLFLVLRTTNLFGGRSSENEMELIYQLLAERSFGQPRGERTGKALSGASKSERSSQSWYPDKTSEARRCQK